MTVMLVIQAGAAVDNQIVFHSLKYGGVSMKNKFFNALSLALIAAMLVTSLALADNVQNDVVAGGNDTITAGDSTTVNYRIAANSGDGQSGCNAADSSPATVTINAPAGVTATPSSLSFTSCGTDKSVSFTSSTPGDYEITVSVSDSGAGTYNTTPAKFTLYVNAAPPPSDTTAPVITPSVSGTLGENGWYVSNVTVSWTVEDGESAISSTSGCAPITINTDTTGTTLTCSATSAGGTSSQSVTIKRDATNPEVSLVGGPADGGSYYFGSVPAAPTCSASDATSGLAGVCSVSGYSAAVGTHTVSASATDNAGNSASDSATYTVLAWTLNGFYQPVDMSGVYNTVRGGSTVPLKFEVFAGSTELTSTTAVLSFVQTRVACDGSAPQDDIEITSTGGTSLRYDTTGGQFIQNWQTPRQAGACYRVTMTAQDGSSLVAFFKLK
jgi:hypothetical protein